MALHRTKGHSLLYLVLLLVLLPSLVVSRRISKQRPVNEASIGEKVPQSTGLMIDSSLIAQPEEQSVVDYKPRLPRSPAVAHQQSTNTAAARRDLHYKQLRRARGAIGDSFRTMIVRDASALNEKRSKGNFLPGQINALNEESLVPEAKHARAFLPPKIVYAAMSQLPTPFVRPGQQEQGRAFALANFIVKNREPMSPRSFGFQKDAKDSQDTVESSSSEKLTDQSVLTPLTTKVFNDEAMNEGYALFHRIVEEGTTNSQSFDANYVVDEDEQIAVKAEATSKYEEYDNDGETFDDFKDDARSEDSRYEFGYRVIDHVAGSDFGHEESHRVPGETNGRYHVLLPDGRVQRVEYYADDSGYHADISYARNDDEPHRKH